MSKNVPDFENIIAYMVQKVGRALSASAHMAKKKPKKGGKTWLSNKEQQKLK